MAFQIVVDDRQVKQYLKKFPREVPFAMSLALNDTAKEVRKHIVNTVWPRSVTRRSRGFAGRAFRTRFARKNSLLAAVYADPSRVSPEGIEAIDRTSTGRRHFPFRSRYLAVPSTAALTPTGRLKKVAKAALLETDKTTFVRDLRGRGPGIWKRMGDGRLQLLFTLHPSVPTPEVFPFDREAERKAREKWPGAIRRAAIRAVKTSTR